MQYQELYGWRNRKLKCKKNNNKKHKFEILWSGSTFHKSAGRETLFKIYKNVSKFQTREITISRTTVFTSGVDEIKHEYTRKFRITGNGNRSPRTKENGLMWDIIMTTIFFPLKCHNICSTFTLTESLPLS
jgi:hypothetical protein